MFGRSQHLCGYHFHISYSGDLLMKDTTDSVFKKKKTLACCSALVSTEVVEPKHQALVVRNMVV